MSWAKLDDQMLNHPKIASVGALGFAMHVAGIVYCSQHLTDGFVPRGAALTLLNFEGVGIINGMSGRDADCLWIIEHGVTPYLSLEEAGLWITTAGGWDIHDYLVYNPTREKVLADREEGRLRVADHRAKKRAAKAGNAVSNAVTPPVSNGPVTPTPSPSPSELPTVVRHSPEGPVDNWAGGVIELMLTTERAKANGHVKNQQAWDRQVRARLEGEHLDHIEKLHAEWPDAPASVIAGAALGETNSLRYYQRTGAQ